ncbi:MAG: hypothetical protein APF77_15075 [Clostridia bacterium BRH_c25]|nr:MAG: hypothetical protein APF77_15075 [Clostridia bacterium BRH_c25]
MKQGVCVPWVAEVFALERGSTPLTFAGCEAPPRGQTLKVRFSGVVGAEQLSEIGWGKPHVLCGLAIGILWRF